MNKQASSMTSRRLVAAAVACVLAWPILVAAQTTPSLAEVARREAERRKALKESGKVITAKDLPESARNKPAGAAAPASGSGSASGATSAPAGAQSTAGDSSQKDENYWRQRITQAQEGLRRSQSFAEALQSRINALTTDFVNRDDPYQRAKIGQDRQSALAELDKVKAEIEAFKKQLADIEEDARKAGVPPGWLR